MLQAIIFLLGHNLFVGALAGCFYFAGREIAQAEYRSIEHSETKLRKDMPMFNGLNPKCWTAKSFFADLLIPSVITFTIALFS